MKQRPPPISISSSAAPCARHGRIFARSPQAGVEVRAEGEVLTLSLSGAVGDDIRLEDVKSALAQARGPVAIELNSPGGDVFEGIAIYNALLAHAGKISIKVLGLAASAASIIAMSADELEIGSGAFLMIHNAWALSVGNADDHEAMSSTLREVDASLAGIYAARTGKSVADIAAMMKAETWLNADRSVELGFADRTAAGPLPQARFDLRIYAHAPAELQAGAPAVPRLEARSDLERLLKDAGLSGGAAKAIAAGGFRALSRDTDHELLTTLNTKLAAATAELSNLRN
ncbi:MAG: head maturation protease, ClpP-related [Pseudomonadota bacterium]